MILGYETLSSTAETIRNFSISRSTLSVLIIKLNSSQSMRKNYFGKCFTYGFIQKWSRREHSINLSLLSPKVVTGGSDDDDGAGSSAFAVSLFDPDRQQLTKLFPSQSSTELVATCQRGVQSDNNAKTFSIRSWPASSVQDTPRP